MDNTGCYALLSFLFYYPSDLSRVHAGFVSSARGCDSFEHMSIDVNLCISTILWLHEQNEGVRSGKSGRSWNEGLISSFFCLFKPSPRGGVFLAVRWHQPFFDSICDIFRLYTQLHLSCPCDISFCNIGVCNSSCGYQL